MTDSTPADELNFRRVFQAPRALVFRCMLEPEHLTHFWGPNGTSTPLAGITIEARPGGLFQTTMVSDEDGSEYTMQARFDEIVEPERIVFTDLAMGMTTTSTFTELGDARTEVHIRQTNCPEFVRSADAQAGFLTSLDRFDAYLRATHATPR
jgi:uncharacterized protein YndB with AHSA1/START domain